MHAADYLMGIVFLKHVCEDSAIEDDFETFKILKQITEINLILLN